MQRSDLFREARLYACVAGVHAVNGLAMPLEVDFWRLVFADAGDKLVDQSDPLVEIGVLHRIAVVWSAVMIDVGSEAIAKNGSLFARDSHIDLHSFREDFPAQEQRGVLPFVTRRGQTGRIRRSSFFH